MPPIQESLQLGEIAFISQRGIALLWFRPTPTFYPWLGVVALGTAVAWGVWRVRQRYQDATGRAGYAWPIAVGVWLLFALVGWGVMSPPLRTERPRIAGLAYEGGLILTPEFASLLVGLVVYTGAFIAEVVRGAFSPSAKGRLRPPALGLQEGQIFRLIILPRLYG